MKNRLIIVEGPQGTGKSTLANYLRETISGSSLFRLSGQKDKSMLGLRKSALMYDALMKYLESMENVPMDLIFDRTFMSEEVYSRLGYKDYSFSDTFDELVERLNSLGYDIYYFSLYLKDLDLFEERLNREGHHNYQSFSVNSSIMQQSVYEDIADELDEFDNINVYNLCMDDFDKSYKEVRKVLKLR